MILSIIFFHPQMVCTHPHDTSISSCISCSGCLVTEITSKHLIFSPQAKLQIYGFVNEFKKMEYKEFEKILHSIDYRTNNNTVKYEKINDNICTTTTNIYNINIIKDMITNTLNIDSSFFTLTHLELTYKNLKSTNNIVTECPYLRKLLIKKNKNIINIDLPQNITYNIINDSTGIVTSHNKNDINEITVEEFLEVTNIKDKILDYDKDKEFMDNTFSKTYNFNINYTKYFLSKDPNIIINDNSNINKHILSNNSKIIINNKNYIRTTKINEIEENNNFYLLELLCNYCNKEDSNKIIQQSHNKVIIKDYKTKINQIKQKKILPVQW